MNSSIDSYYSTLVMCAYYLFIGTIAFLANLLNLHMYTYSKEARKTYMCFIALELGELINSLSFILTGAGRLETLYAGQMYQPITKYWPHALILGTQIPTLFLIFTSFERISVVCWPARFNIDFYRKLNRVLVAGCLFLACVSLSAAAASARNNQNSSNSGHCGIIHSTAKWYSTAHFIFIIVGYGASLLSLCVLKIYTMKFRYSSKNGLRRDTKTSILIAYTATSLVLVASPSVVMIGLRWNWFALDDIWVALTYSTTGMVSIANMFINFAFREEFRLARFCCRNSVGIISNPDMFSSNQ